MSRLLKQHFDGFKKVVEKYRESSLPVIENMAQTVADCFLNGGKLYLCGYGLSAGLPGHMEKLFLNKCRMARPPFPAIALSLDAALSPDNISELFEKQVTAFLGPADVLWAFSAEPAMEMTVRAMRAASLAQVKVICMSGKDTGTLRGLCDILMNVDHMEPLKVLEFHLIASHALCDRVDEIIFTPNIEDGEENEP